MDSVNKTLYIPLYGKAYVSRRGILLHDPKAEQLWDAESFPLKGKSRSKWLAYYMGMRSAVFDRWLAAKLAEAPDAVVLHLGCGLDSRVLRLNDHNNSWYDVDFPEVIQERRRHYQEDARYHMIGADIRCPDWLDTISRGGIGIIVMEGISMYLSPAELQTVLTRLNGHFDSVHVLMDCYTELAAKASRHRNPINEVGVTQVWGLDDPKALEPSGLTFVQTHDMTPADMIAELAPMERVIFKAVYAGKLSKNLYRMYEFQ